MSSLLSQSKLNNKKNEITELTKNDEVDGSNKSQQQVVTEEISVRNNQLEGLKKRGDFLEQRIVTSKILETLAKYNYNIRKIFNFNKRWNNEAYQNVINCSDEFLEINFNNLSVETIESALKKIQLLNMLLFDTLEVSKLKEQKQFNLLRSSNDLNKELIEIPSIEKFFPKIYKRVKAQTDNFDLMEQFIKSWSNSYDVIIKNKKSKDQDKEFFLQEKYNIACKKLSNSKEVSKSLLKNNIIEEKMEEYQKLINDNSLSIEERNKESEAIKNKYELKYDNLLKNLNSSFKIKEDSIERAYNICLAILSKKITNHNEKPQELLEKRSFMSLITGTKKEELEKHLKNDYLFNNELFNEVLSTSAKLNEKPYIKKELKLVSNETTENTIEFSC